MCYHTFELNLIRVPRTPDHLRSSSPTPSHSHSHADQQNVTSDQQNTPSDKFVRSTSKSSLQNVGRRLKPPRRNNSRLGDEEGSGEEEVGAPGEVVEGSGGEWRGEGSRSTSRRRHPPLHLPPLLHPSPRRPPRDRSLPPPDVVRVSSGCRLGVVGRLFSSIRRGREDRPVSIPRS